jgi:radical SAM superfamily enzyme YgiQ (UPF0313 family)
VPEGEHLRSDGWGRGAFHAEDLPRPEPLTDVPRRWRRYGVQREVFRATLEESEPFDAALISGGMSYWYPGVREVIEDLRQRSPGTRIVLGGVYPTLCPEHAASLGVDVVIEGSRLAPLWRMIGLEGDMAQPPLWEARHGSDFDAAVIKLTDGCPYACTYCAVHRFFPEFTVRPLEQAMAELEHILSCGISNVAFYDDALLCDSGRALVPFLQEVIRRGTEVNFHTPNALHARLLSPNLARLMVEAGFKTFYLGFESASDAWHAATGEKTSADDLARAADALRDAGADMDGVTAYVIIGHPRHGEQDVEVAIQYAHDLGLRVMLAEFSPIPGTPDGEACRRWVDIDEPLWHNKTAFTLVRLGESRTNELKDLCRELNQGL